MRASFAESNIELQPSNDSIAVSSIAQVRSLILDISVSVSFRLCSVTEEHRETLEPSRTFTYIKLYSAVQC